MRSSHPSHPSHPSQRAHQDLLDRWLSAERADRTAEAEAALASLFSALPPLQPPAGFADRLLLRAGLAQMPQTSPVPQTSRSLFASLWMRGLLTACLLAIGISALWLPQALHAIAGMLSMADLVRIWTGTVVVVCRWMGSAVGLWDFLLTVGRALATPLETPAVALALVSCLLVSMIAFRFLRDLITRDRSLTYVDL